MKQQDDAGISSQNLVNSFDYLQGIEQSINKNSFLVSYDGLEVDEQMKIVVNDLKHILQVLKLYQQARQEYSNNKISLKDILEHKIGKLCKKYKYLFRNWSEEQFPPTQSSEQIKNQMNKSDIQKKSKEYWIKSFSDLKKILTKEIKIIPKPSSAKDLHKNFEKPSLKINPQLISFVSHLSKQINLYLYLPSILKLNIVGVNQIDVINSKASIILNVELKVKFPENTSDYDINLYHYLSKIKIAVKSNKMINQQENLITILKQGPEEQQQNLLFKDPVYQNDQTTNFTVWTDFKKYYTHSLAQRFLDKSDQQLKEILKKIRGFDGIIFTAKLKDVQVSIQPHDLFAPFQILDLNGYIQINPIEAKTSQWFKDLNKQLKGFSIDPNATIKFNIVEIGFSENNLQSIASTKQNIQINNYGLAEKMIKVEISDNQISTYTLRSNFCNWNWREVENKRIRRNGKKDHKVQYRGDNLAHFHFPFFKHPLKSLISIFLPNVVLGIINIFIFFQPTDLADRIANLSTLLISFVAMIAILQTQIRSRKVNITVILTYILMLTPLLLLIRSMSLYKKDQQPEPLIDWLFIACIIIIFLNVAYPTVLYLFYRFKWIPAFNINKFVSDKTVILPGDRVLNRLNIIDKQKYHYMKALNASKDIEDWKKLVQGFVIDRLKDQLQKESLLKTIEELAEIYPRFHDYLKGKYGEIQRKILNPTKKN